MTDAITRIREALAKHTENRLQDGYRHDLWDACNPAAVAKVLALVDQQAAEIAALRDQMTADRKQALNWRDEASALRDRQVRGEPFGWWDKDAGFSSKQGYGAKALYLAPQPAHTEAEVQKLKAFMDGVTWNFAGPLVRRILGVEAPK